MLLMGSERLNTETLEAIMLENHVLKSMKALLQPLKKLGMLCKM